MKPSCTYIFFLLLILSAQSVSGNAISCNEIMSISLSITPIDIQEDSGITVIYAVEGIFQDATTDDPVKGVQVTITNKRNSRYHTQSTGEDGKFKFELHDQSLYSLIGIKPKYFESNPVNISTIGRMEGEIMNLSLPISKITIGQSYQLTTVTFDINHWELQSESEDELLRIVKALQNNPTLIVEIGVHTDARGSEKHNMELTIKRAKAIHNTMKKLGMYSSRLRVIPYGETKPLNHCGDNVKCKTSEHLKNRRIELKVINI